MSNDEMMYEIIKRYKEELQKKIKEREQEMQSDNNEHYLIYKALGFTSKEGYLIDYQQNVGRFLYKYAGSLLEELKKEHKRVRIIREAGYIPVRIMFFESNREQAKKIQNKLKQLYEDIGGEYYSGENAWKYIEKKTGINLKSVFEKMKE